ncbi:MAG: conjugal transfer protein TraF [Marinospirillum sp.]|uniref:conjugal transfer protein TraF n=1 Tax=Marinospirillum sp. TaxID=2183934 RepID=UPI0019F71EC9|nr:conjugal transfer protein TraF [Marinospirillum sp.]MBE0506133.1 conjugal transfer protein TraF [Marinospirillum sp.]
MTFKPTRIALALAALSLPFAAVTASANQSLVSPGYSATIGGVSNRSSIHSSSHNPASNSILIKQDEKMRFGYLSNLGGYLELGEVDDLDLVIDNLVDDMDAVDTINLPSSKQRLAERYPNVERNNQTESQLEAAYLEAISSEVNNNLLAELEKGGQIRFGTQIQAPLTPFLIRSEKARGTFSVNASASMQFKGGFLGGPFGVETTFKAGNTSFGAINLDLTKVAGIVPDLEDIVDDTEKSDADKVAAIETLLANNGMLAGNEATIEALKKHYNVKTASVTPASSTLQSESKLTTNSGLDVRAATLAHLGLGYGTNLTNWSELTLPKGELELGARLNLYQVELARNFVSIQAENNSNDNDSTSDKLTDDFTDNTTNATALGLDVGMLWHDDNFQAGLTIYNLNEPSFDYPDLATYLTGETLTALQGLEVAGKTKVADSVSMTRHAVLEGAYYTDNRNWVVQGYFTLGTATNLVGDESQDMGISAGYFSQSFLVPAFRIGYNKNLAGTKLSTVNAGTTLFGIINMDLAMGLESSSFDGTDIPRYVGFNLGFEEKF